MLQGCEVSVHASLVVELRRGLGRVGAIGFIAVLILVLILIFIILFILRIGIVDNWLLLHLALLLL